MGRDDGSVECRTQAARPIDPWREAGNGGRKCPSRLALPGLWSMGLDTRDGPAVRDGQLAVHQRQGHVDSIALSA